MIIYLQYIEIQTLFTEPLFGFWNTKEKFVAKPGSAFLFYGEMRELLQLSSAVSKQLDFFRSTLKMDYVFINNQLLPSIETNINDPSKVRLEKHRSVTIFISFQLQLCLQCNVAIMLWHYILRQDIIKYTNNGSATAKKRCS